MTTATLDEITELALKLSPEDKRQLVERLTTRNAESDEALHARHAAARAQRQKYYEETAALGPVSPTAGEILDEDRRHRDAVLMGIAHTDVHD